MKFGWFGLNHWNSLSLCSYYTPMDKCWNIGHLCLNVWLASLVTKLNYTFSKPQKSHARSFIIFNGFNDENVVWFLFCLFDLDLVCSCFCLFLIFCSWFCLFYLWCLKLSWNLDLVYYIPKSHPCFMKQNAGMQGKENERHNRARNTLKRSPIQMVYLEEEKGGGLVFSCWVREAL